MQAGARLRGGRGVRAQAAGGHQRLGVGQVGVRVPAAKVLLGVAVHQARRVGAQLLRSQDTASSEFALHTFTVLSAAAIQAEAQAPKGSQMLILQSFSEELHVLTHAWSASNSHTFSSTHLKVHNAALICSLLFHVKRRCPCQHTHPAHSVRR